MQQVLGGTEDRDDEAPEDEEMQQAAVGPDEHAAMAEDVYEQRLQALTGLIGPVIGLARLEQPHEAAGAAGKQGDGAQGQQPDERNGNGRADRRTRGLHPGLLTSTGQRRSFLFAGAAANVTCTGIGDELERAAGVAGRSARRMFGRAILIYYSRRGARPWPAGATSNTGWLLAARPWLDFGEEIEVLADALGAGALVDAHCRRDILQAQPLRLEEGDLIGAGATAARARHYVG